LKASVCKKLPGERRHETGLRGVPWRNADCSGKKNPSGGTSELNAQRTGPSPGGVHKRGVKTRYEGEEACAQPGGSGGDRASEAISQKKKGAQWGLPGKKGVRP